MALTQQKFILLANKFMNSTFSDFKKSLVMRTADSVTYGSAQTWTLEPLTGSNYGIPLTLDFSLFDSSLIEIGDFLIFTNSSVWTTNPQGDNVDIVFDGITMQIINVEKDPANAAYFLTVRRK